MVALYRISGFVEKIRVLGYTIAVAIDWIGFPMT